MATTDRLSGLDMGISLKPACTVASTANITLTAAQTIDDIAVSSSMRVLVMGQTDTTENGIYGVRDTTWVRTRDFDGAYDGMPGTLVYVDRGTTYGKTIWAFNSSSTATSITIGTDNIVLSQVL